MIPNEEMLQDDKERAADLLELVVGERQGRLVVADGVEHAQRLAHVDEELLVEGVEQEALAELGGAQQQLLHRRLPLAAGRVDALRHGRVQLVAHQTHVLLGAVAALLELARRLHEDGAGRHRTDAEDLLVGRRHLLQELVARVRHDAQT